MHEGIRGAFPEHFGLPARHASTSLEVRGLELAAVQTESDAGGAISAGGLRQLIPAVARTAVAVGVDGVFLEVHNDPDASPCDAPTQWPLRHLHALLEELVQIAHASRGREAAAELDLRPLPLD